jgi:hypothetical protein
MIASYIMLGSAAAQGRPLQPVAGRRAPRSESLPRMRVQASYDYSRAVAKGGLKHPPRRRSASSGIGFDSQSVVHRNPELLLASEVALGRLDGDVAEQELDLIQFAARDVAKPRAGAPQVVRG